MIVPESVKDRGEVLWPFRVALSGKQASASPFEMADWSVKERMTGDWKAKVLTRIRKVDQVIVMCGEHTDTASGVSAELAIAQDEKKPYFLLAGRANKTCKKPKSAKTSDKLYKWTWDNLKKLIGGAR